MEWFIENPVGMLAMQDCTVIMNFVAKFTEVRLPMVRQEVDCCAWGHVYMKPTHGIVWKSLAN